MILKKAQALKERALAIREKVLGPHPDTAESMNNLAVLLQKQGNLATARPLFERVLAIENKVRDPEHPYMARILNNLGNLLRLEGRLSEAQPFHERALAIREKILGQSIPKRPGRSTILRYCFWTRVNLRRLYRSSSEP